MSDTDLDLEDLQAWRSFLDSRGIHPGSYRVEASPSVPGEGALGVSQRTATVTHVPTGTRQVYPFRTWVEEFGADIDRGVFDG